jgi:hypothetical protein
MTAEMLLSRIEAILADIEAIHDPELLEPEDREAFDVVCRIERRLLAKKKND